MPVLWYDVIESLRTRVCKHDKNLPTDSLNIEAGNAYHLGTSNMTKNLRFHPVVNTNSISLVP